MGQTLQVYLCRSLKQPGNETYLRPDLPVLPSRHLLGVLSIQPRMVGEFLLRKVYHPLGESFPLIVLVFLFGSLQNLQIPVLLIHFPTPSSEVVDFRSSIIG